MGARPISGDSPGSKLERLGIQIHQGNARGGSGETTAVRKMAGADADIQVICTDVPVDCAFSSTLFPKTESLDPIRTDENDTARDRGLIVFAARMQLSLRASP
jgi:hypothetical protein